MDPTRPDPVKTSVSHLRVGHRCYTAIHRDWPPGAAGPAGSCRRCRECTAEGDSCHFHLARFVPAEDAPDAGRPG